VVETMLTKGGVNLDTLTNKGKSPLRLAAERNHTKVITLLLRQDALLDEETLNLLTRHSIKLAIFNELQTLVKPKAIPELKKILDKTTPLGKVFHAQRNSTLLGGKAPSLFNPRSVLYDVVQELERLGEDVLSYRAAAKQENQSGGLLNRLMGGRGNSDVDRPHRIL